MKHDIAEKNGQVVGYAQVLDDGDLSITFHDVWVGCFKTFQAWNCTTGNMHTLVVDTPKVVDDFQLLDISLVEIDEDSENHIKIGNTINSDADWGLCFKNRGKK